MTQAQTGCHIGMNLLGSSGCHCWLELGCQSVDRAIQRSGAYLSRPHFILKRIQHGKRLKTSQRCPYLAGENVSKTKEEKRMGVKKERRRPGSGAWKSSKAIAWGQDIGCHLPVWQPHQGVFPSVPACISRDWQLTTVFTWQYFGGQGLGNSGSRGGTGI